MAEDIDCYGTSEVVCPYCGEEFSDSWEFANSGVIECCECGRTFRYERELDVSYTSFPLPDGEEGEVCGD